MAVAHYKTVLGAHSSSFIFHPFHNLRTFPFSFSLPGRNSGPASPSRVFSPPHTTVRDFVFIATRFQQFIPSSTRIELHPCIMICCTKTKYTPAVRSKTSRLRSVGCVQTIPGVFTPGITLQITSVSYVGHSYPYPELLSVL